MVMSVENWNKTGKTQKKERQFYADFKTIHFSLPV